MSLESVKSLEYCPDLVVQSLILKIHSHTRRSGLSLELWCPISFHKAYEGKSHFADSEGLRYKDMNDESVKSSLQPNYIAFHEYNADEIREILNMKVEESLNKYNPDPLGLLSAMLVSEYRSDARIGIRALEWDGDSVRTALKQAYMEVKGETLKNLGDRNLLILAALIKNQDTNRVHSEVSASNNILLRGVSKSTFFQSVNYQQNLGLITLIKKKIGR